MTEMIYLWNGMKKQGSEQLQKSLDSVQWGKLFARLIHFIPSIGEQSLLTLVSTDRASHPDKFKDDLDEQAIHTILVACIERNNGKYDEARALLQNGVLKHDRYVMQPCQPSTL